MKHVFLFLFLILSLYSNPTDKKFISTNYTSTDGLANNIVSSITQDSQGFLWIGTYGGLNRYDGKEFKTYTMTNGLAFDAVRAVYADVKEKQIENDIWVGTELGLSILRNGKVLEDSKSKPFLDFFKGQNIRAILKTKDDIYLVGTVENLFTIGKDNKVEAVKSAKGKQIQTLFLASNNTIWVGTKREGLFQLSKDSKSIQKVGSIYSEILSIQEEISSKEDSSKKLIVSYADDRIYSYTLEGEEEEIYNPQIKSISKKGRYLICKNNLNQTLSFFSKIEDSYLYEDNSYSEYSIGNINTCYIDREGTFWVGTYGSGLTKFYRRKVDSYTNINGLPNPNVRYIIKNREGDLWIGTQFSIFSKVNEKFKVIDENPKKKKALDKVRAIIEDDDNRIWFGSENGLLYLEGKKLKEIQLEKSKNANIYSMDHFNGFLYILEGKGKVYRIDLNDTSQVNVITFKPEEEVPWRIIRSLDKKNLYLQTSKRILELKKKSKKELEEEAAKANETPAKETNPSSDKKILEADEKFTQLIRKDEIKASNGEEIEVLNKIQSFLPIEKNHFVFGDNKLFIKKGKEIRVKTQKDGLPEGQIVSISKDDENNLWIGTSKGIANYK
ncbi:MAG TPA: two-component regulator propeller domain-containing protein, partial [Leptospiraceae bacterium]|nr:two-component regulator propeller domain-containing protein [Leptospiraceae bacterium]